MIRIFKDTKELSLEFCDELMKISSQKEKCFIALSGGSTPKIIFHSCSEHFKDKIQWYKIYLFWSDERCVSPDDSESNYGMAKQYLLNYINIFRKKMFIELLERMSRNRKPLDIQRK
jgi:6-phosphogluconolactonase